MKRGDSMSSGDNRICRSGERRSQSNEAFATSELARFAEPIIQCLPSGVMALDANGRIIITNRSAIDFLGGDAAQFAAGVYIEDLPIAAPFMDVMREVMTEQKPISRREIILTVAEGQKREIGLSASLMKGPDQFNGVVFLFTDMTERRNVERAAELNRQLASLGELTAGVVHELRNPVMVISGMAEWLVRKAEDETMRDTGQTIFEEAAHLEKTISQFLGFARPFELEVTRCHPETIVSRTMRLCQQRAQEKGVTLSQHLPEGLPGMEADPGRVAQALANIVNNAIDAVPAETGRVELRVQRVEADTVFEVVDNGPGIDPAAGDTLFKPFLSQKEGGTGLGLAIVHRIVTAHSGTVAYACPEEGGTRFEVRLPTQKGALW